MDRINYAKCISIITFLFIECLVQIQKHFRAFFATTTQKKKKQERRTINKPVSKYLKKTLHDHKQINVNISTMHRNRDNFPFKYGIHMYMFMLKSEWLLFHTNSAIAQLYHGHGENKLIFNEKMMKFAWY